MSWGTLIQTASGEVLTAQDVIGGLYVATISCSITSGTQVFDYPSVPAGALYGLQLGAGSHTWAISANGAGCRVTFTYAGVAYNANKTSNLKLFARDSFEPDFGVETRNDVGERIISSIFPASRFLGKITLNPSATNNSHGSLNSWTYTSYPLGAVSGETIVLWSLPNQAGAGAGGWWGQGVVTSGGVAKMYYRGTAYSGPLPEGFVFSTAPLSPSGSWGVQVFNQAQQLMYDSSSQILAIKSLITGLSYLCLLSPQLQFPPPTPLLSTSLGTSKLKSLGRV